MVWLKVGKSTFNKDAVSKMSFKEFEKLHKHLEKVCDLKDVYKKCGGKVKTDEVRETE